MTRPLDEATLAVVGSALCDSALAGVVGMLSHFELRLEATLRDGSECDRSLSRALDDLLVAYGPLRDELLAREDERQLLGTCA